MARHYSTKDFFRQMPNALLARYFATHGVLTDFDLTAIKETRIDALFDAWMELPEAARVRLESDLREICDMACPVGTQAILDEAEFHLDDDKLANFRDGLMALPGHHERAMTVFLDHANLWRGATRFHHADTLSYWRKRKNLPRVAAAADPASLRSLEAAIRCYYRVSEGRGRHCRVEPYRRGDRDYFFAFPEDYAQQSVEWEGDDFSVRPHHPAFEVVFVYRRSEGTLDLYVPGNRKAVEPLQGIFAEHILKCEDLPADPADTRVYDLGVLRRREFAFSWAPESGIESVAVSRLRLSLHSPRNAKLIVEADTKHRPDAVYDLLETLAPVFPGHSYLVTQVGIAARIKPNTHSASKQVNFTVSFPNSCSLKHDEVGLKLRAMLWASGIEPREPEVLVDGEGQTKP
ncbi:MAG: hypothetical protein ABTS16_12880 [Candidatus Accumulibacter phosphatis]|jgi:hypothetical protein|uniref:hypothetical protein n=1 Tax=Candidatus Accumulibacter contiguus TaxID=2954381 RepID=UPI002FC2C948